MCGESTHLDNTKHNRPGKLTKPPSSTQHRSANPPSPHVSSAKATAPGSPASPSPSPPASTNTTTCSSTPRPSLSPRTRRRWLRRRSCRRSLTLLKCSWLAIFAILLFRAARWVGSIWMMALWAWRVRRVRCWGFGGSGGRLLRCDKVRGGCGEGGEGWGRCVGDWKYGMFQVAVCVVRFDLLNTPVLCIMSSFETHVPLSLCCSLIPTVSLHHISLRHLECPGSICDSIIRYHSSTLRHIHGTPSLASMAMSLSLRLASKEAYVRACTFIFSSHDIWITCTNTGMITAS